MGQCGPHSSRRPHRGGGNRGPHAGTPSCYPDKRGSPSIFPQPARPFPYKSVLKYQSVAVIPFYLEYGPIPFLQYEQPLL